MKINNMLEEIREANLTYLMLAQNMIREDKPQAMYRLGVSEDVASVIESLTPAQRAATQRPAPCLLGSIREAGRHASQRTPFSFCLSSLKYLPTDRWGGASSARISG